jgi:putative membrane protein
MHGDVSTGWMIVMMIGMVLFWAAVILGIVCLVRGASGGGWHWGGVRKETPGEILERRFAEGAISVKDYEERREVIARGVGTVKPLATLSDGTAPDARRLEPR